MDYSNSFMKEAPTRTASENWEAFKSTLLSAANKHIPRKKARKRHSQPWITPQIRRAMRKRDKLQDSTDTAAIRHQGVLTADPKEKAEALGEQFESVFTKEDTNIIPTLGEPSVPTTPELKHGFRKGLSCETQLLVTTHDLAHGLDQNLQIDAVVLDFSKAFDTVPHQRLLSKLQYYGIKGHILSWLKAFLTERTQTVVLDGESSKPSRVTSGVPQGTSPTDAQGLQADLDALTEWQDLHISNDMRWDAHIAHATGKANRTLGVIRRNLCHCTSQVKNTCYKALVRPQLEYCASVWDPYTAGGVQAVERVQRRAARMVMNDYARTSSRYPLRGCCLKSISPPVPFERWLKCPTGGRYRLQTTFDPLLTSHVGKITCPQHLGQIAEED
ncbi:hypothetical protein Bbelb_113660 [Branchiostoma belcheri]|nr:hypothetical protein Bbelb_113660 [Branchiostoma belcheri]